MKKELVAAPTAATSNKAKPLPLKIIALTHLLKRSLITLEATSLYGDTALHSTISTLTHKHGLVFHRKRVTHQHRHGRSVYFTRYTLSDDSRETAEALVKHYKGAEA
ncbi:helix-turn-helix domain-containing protein [Neptunomonas antarctica]|uniref:Helix-turn-helix domain-containing protein n=1 Tax=Neptunomonas antarctica TaxID=619304 RepID=A0A1N7M991_9GAMM|nr:helix-turn-helix domain-containing protein [Neptunomonas antarctica]SIS82658.1 Helix-turn-helix domain-containing protein [Neptunomonas antarctica]